MATDLADHLVRRGVAFREAHRIVGQVVRLAEDKGVDLADLDPDEISSVSDQFGDEAVNVFNIRDSLVRREGIGGTAPGSLLHQLDSARAQLRL